MHGNPRPYPEATIWNIDHSQRMNVEPYHYLTPPNLACTSAWNFHSYPEGFEREPHRYHEGMNGEPHPHPRAIHVHPHSQGVNKTRGTQPLPHIHHSHEKCIGIRTPDLKDFSGFSSIP